MDTRIERRVRHVRSGDYLAEVDVELHYRDDKDYSPTLSMQDALRVERVHKALAQGDVQTASREARVYRLTPISAA